MIKSLPLWKISGLCLALFLGSMALPTYGHAAASDVYHVRSGETLNGIAHRLGVKAESLISHNHLKAPYRLQAGQILMIPEGQSSYIVQSGDTGLSLAHRYQISWQRIISLNHLQPPYRLREGMKLILPTASLQSHSEESRDNHLNVKQIVGGAQPATPHNHDSEKAGQPLHFGWPARGSIIRSYGRTENGHVNNGLDIAAAMGSPIFAAEDGHVAYTGTHISILGGVILIQHAQGWTTVYGHLDNIKVKHGDFVRKGEVIASAGESGNTPRPQLHFEIRHGLKAVNPARLLPLRK
ncbi:MAG: M23 family metallopeptidase [Zymomonas mobilis]|uniref:Murein DD-endopeptidase MepM/ murein hydrolase activator NlpD n=1 Tax=Zymomonas mobilis TaxID=542 RepID=A0A542W1E4_ZYMMB|nr:M23 family metallopeptidase [Zymomonas mobilis]TQL17388.1 murein DD-endopeptidase MepM/ murein hydrolase activator NlpD [Zymomonas mobilis]